MDGTGLVVRVAANLAELRTNLAEGVNQIETTSTAMRNMSAAYDGSRAIAQAGAVVEAIRQVGGVTHLTAAEQASANTVLEAAIQKYEALGKVAPAGMQALADATKQTSHTWGEFVDHFNVREAIENPLGAAKEAMTAFAGTLGPVGTIAAEVAGVLVTVGGSLFELAAHAAEAGEGVLTFMRMTGAAAEDVGTLSAAATIGGSSLDALQAVLFQVQRRMDATGPAAEKFDQALADLNINAAEFRNADPTERIALLSKGMHDSAGSTTMLSDAIALMGRGAMENLPLLMKNFEDLKEQGKALGYQWSVEDVNASEAFSEAANRTGVELSTMATTVGVALIPAMTLAVDGFNRTILAMEHIVDLGGLVSGAYRAVTDEVGNLALREAEAGAVIDTTNHLFAIAAAEGLSMKDQIHEVAVKMLDLGYSQTVVSAQTGLTLQAVKDLAGELRSTATAAHAYSDAWGRVNAALAEGPPSLAAVSASQRGLVADMHAAKVSIDDMSLATGLSVGQIRLLVTAQDDAEAATKKLAGELKRAAEQDAKRFADAMANIDAAGMSWRDTLADMNPGLVEDVKQMLAAGVAAHDLEVAWGILPTKMKAIEMSVKDDTEALKLNTRAQAELEKAADDYYKAVNAASHDSVQRQIDDAYLAADARIVQMKKTQTYSVEAEMKIWQAADQTARNIEQKTLESNVHSKEHYVLLADQAKAAYDFALAHLDSYTTADVEAMRVTAESAKRAADGWTTSLGPAIDEVNDKLDKTKKKADDVRAAMTTGTVQSQFSLNPNDPASWAAKVASFGATARVAYDSHHNPYVYIPGVNAAPPRAEGGPVAAGQPYTVGERGPELFVPQRDGAIVPNGAGGATVNIAAGAVVLNFPVMNDAHAKDQIAQLVGDALVARFAGHGGRLPSGV